MRKTRHSIISGRPHCRVIRWSVSTSQSSLVCHARRALHSIANGDAYLLASGWARTNAPTKQTTDAMRIRCIVSLVLIAVLVLALVLALILGLGLGLGLVLLLMICLLVRCLCLLVRALVLVLVLVVSVVLVVHVVLVVFVVFVLSCIRYSEGRVP